MFTQQLRRCALHGRHNWTNYRRSARWRCHLRAADHRWLPAVNQSGKLPPHVAAAALTLTVLLTYPHPTARLQGSHIGHTAPDSVISRLVVSCYARHAPDSRSVPRVLKNFDVCRITKDEAITPLLNHTVGFTAMHVVYKIDYNRLIVRYFIVDNR